MRRMLDRLPASSRLIALALLAATLAGCAGGPPKRVYPPQARIQELVAMPDGSVTVKLRVQNYSNVPMQYSRITAALELQGQPSAKLDIPTDIGVGPGSAEIIEHRVSLDAAAAGRIADSLRDRRSLRYQLKGRIISQEPRGDYEFEYQSALDPVPGLTGVLR